MASTMSTTAEARHFVTMGMFIVDQFSFLDDDGVPTGKTLAPQIGGGGTYASIGARIWLPPDQVGMIVDRGHDFPEHIQRRLDSYGEDMWLYRDDTSRGTTKALNEYKGNHRGFAYLTPRVRITPRDLANTPFSHPVTLHFICSPSRAATIMSEVAEVEGWSPVTIYEPIPDRCIPQELPALQDVLPVINILSPNAEEALSLLSITEQPSEPLIEEAARRLLAMGVGPQGTGTVIIRSGALGAYVVSRERSGQWIPAFWGAEEIHRVVDVTGAGNAFLGGLAAGLRFANGDVLQAVLYATVSASFIIEQEGLPLLTTTFGDDGSKTELWNGESPKRRLDKLLLDTKSG